MPRPAKLRHCPVCEQDKPSAAFGQTKKTESGYFEICKECRKSPPVQPEFIPAKPSEGSIRLRISREFQYGFWDWTRYKELLEKLEASQKHGHNIPLHEKDEEFLDRCKQTFGDGSVVPEQYRVTTEEITDTDFFDRPVFEERPLFDLSKATEAELCEAVSKWELKVTALEAEWDAYEERCERFGITLTRNRFGEFTEAGFEALLNEDQAFKDSREQRRQDLYESRRAQLLRDRVNHPTPYTDEQVEKVAWAYANRKAYEINKPRGRHVQKINDDLI